MENTIRVEIEKRDTKKAAELYQKYMETMAEKQKKKTNKE